MGEEAPDGQEGFEEVTYEKDPEEVSEWITESGEMGMFSVHASSAQTLWFSFFFFFLLRLNFPLSPRLEYSGAHHGSLQPLPPGTEVLPPPARESSWDQQACSTMPS